MIWNNIKIKYSEEGFLPDYPYHLISDEEAVNAFIFNDDCMFDTYYPLPDEGLKDKYETLRTYIESKCSKFIEDPETVMDDWIYCYMLGEVINIQSDQKDIHDLLVLLDLDNLYDEFNTSIYESIYDVSSKALGSSTDISRPATIFGEPHIVKYLRLEQVEVL